MTSQHYDEVFNRAVDAAWGVLPSSVAPAKGDVAEALRVASDVFASDDQAYADKLVAETGIAGFNLDGRGRLDLVLAHELAAKMTLAFKTILDAQPGAENYVEQEVIERNGGGRYVFIVCKPGGKTPHQLRREAESQRDALLSEVEELRRRLGDSA
ncbi:hypothetical protein GCM10010172_04650 [Paractinoplanes ferrugineus]|uniref:Uncharacterized protein n=1 Tax=Paractinoplanes ferrugineus TaxID=113564 RepID=A0A919JAR3_9ACTN|nr:hypothetical protein [Actinoplanes ferrugineus]GIE16850.1 hypothetical protein Afe05nite_86900 [Actinoplanes ferrugineus]